MSDNELLNKWEKSGLLLGIESVEDQITLSSYFQEASNFFQIKDVNDIHKQSHLVLLVFPILRRLFNDNKNLNVLEVIRYSEIYLSSNFYQDNVNDLCGNDIDGEVEMLAYFTDNYYKLDHENKNYYLNDKN